MDYKEIAKAIKLCGNSPKIDQCKSALIGWAEI